MNEEPDVLVCVLHDHAHVELSELDVCRECGAQIWVSPSGRSLQSEKNLKLICIRCMPDPDTPDLEIAPLTREQERELMNYWREEHRD